MSPVAVALVRYKGNILRLDLLVGRQWCLPGGRVWSFRSEDVEAVQVGTLWTAPALSPSKLPCVPQYLLPSAAKWDITTLLDGLEMKKIMSLLQLSRRLNWLKIQAHKGSSLLMCQPVDRGQSGSTKQRQQRLPPGSQWWRRAKVVLR